VRIPARWLLCGLLFLATLLNYLDRQTISVSATAIADEMGLKDDDLGRLFFAFLFAYGITQMFLGPVLDRLPVRLAYALAVAAWSLAGAAAALATGFWSLFFFRFLLGVCESPNWPLAMRVVARTFPPAQRALATGIYQCGTSVGALVAPPLIIFLTKQYNWRVAFVVAGAIGLGWVALWLLWFRVQPDMRVDGPESTAIMPLSAPARDRPAPIMDANRPTTLAEILRSRAFWGLLVATCFLNPLQYFYLTWLPRYFQTYAGVDFGQELANRLVLIYLTLDIALLTGGGLVAWLARFVSVVQARRAVAAAGAACMATVPAVAFLDDIDSITAVIGLATFGLGWTMVNYLTFTAEVSVAKVSTAAGILGGAGALAGAGFMLVVGNVVEQSGSFAIAFGLVGAMPIVALGGIWYASGGRE
jgi:ACS family hexuronate transporter-like MFS transporter